jgi:hypothetical protein
MLRQPFAVAVALTAAGLIPFIGCGVVLLLDPVDSPAAIAVLITYGAVILSFLGAVHWGFALRDTAHPVNGVPLTPAVLGAERQLLALGVAPALIAWVALLVFLRIGAPGAALLLLLVGFFLTVVMETIGRGRGVVAGNYLTMRWGASIVVLIIMLAVLFAVWTGMRAG